MKTDYPELEGKTIKFRYDTLSDPIDLLIAGVNYHIGISLVYPDSKKPYACLQQKSWPYMKYRREFYRIVKGLQKGDLIWECLNAENSEKYVMHCPFNK